VRRLGHGAATSRRPTGACLRRSIGPQSVLYAGPPRQPGVRPAFCASAGVVPACYGGVA
jgi:hypothetical protein